jgi:hypothetical protein
MESSIRGMAQRSEASKTLETPKFAVHDFVCDLKLRKIIGPGIAYHHGCD